MSESDRAAEPRSPSRSGWLSALLVAVAGLAVYRFAGPAADPRLDPDAEPRPIAERGDLRADETATIELYERASPSVVFIRNLAVDVDRRYLDPYQIQEGTGSGIVWDELGHVVTNYHVVHNSRELEVTLANHETFAARIVGFEVEKDIAVLQIDAPREMLRPIPIGTSSDLRIGQTVFAIGNPFGLDQTLTSGLISGLGREILNRFVEEGRGQHPITDLIQTDCAINPGNSGGPLLDSAGRLIGMNNAIVTPTGAYAGIGFAIPVDTLQRTVTEILRYGQARRPGLGIYIENDAITRRYGIEGVMIIGVRPGTGAERAGLRGAGRGARGGDDVRRNDVIIAVGGAPVRDSNDLYRELDRSEIGDAVRLTILREGRTLEVEVEIQDLR